MKTNLIWGNSGDTETSLWHTVVDLLQSHESQNGLLKIKPANKNQTGLLDPEFKQELAWANMALECDYLSWRQGKALRKLMRPKAFITPADIRALIALAVTVGRAGMFMADIGTWMGASALALATVAFFNDGKVFCVDTHNWWGDAIFTMFRHIMRRRELWANVISPVMMSSELAIDIFKDESLDLAFIDAAHSYEYVSIDIPGWLPKVRKGGILCGHDADEEHQDVLKVLHETFGDDYLVIPDTSIWYKKL